MKIKLALLDSDQNYLNRIVTAFNIKYADKLEIYSFTKLESAMAALEPSRIDVLVASDTFVVESSALPKRCQLAYFVESADVDSVNDQRAICKFQKADLIYRQILSIYSEYRGCQAPLFRPHVAGGRCAYPGENTAGGAFPVENDKPLSRQTIFRPGRLCQHTGKL